MKLLTTTYKDNIGFTLNCYDRLIFTGSLPEISYSQGMTSFLYKENVRIFDRISDIEWTLLFGPRSNEINLSAKA